MVAIVQKILIPCQEEKTIRFSPCRGYYFDNPCCPEVYIGNNTTTTPTGEGGTTV